MQYNVTQDNSYKLYGGTAISYICEPAPKSMDSPHFHKDYELFFLVKGSRKFFSSNTICSLAPSTVMILEDGEHHQSTVNLNIPSERYAVYVSKKLMEAIFKENKELPPLKSVMCFELDDEVFKEIIKHIKNIEKEFAIKDEFSKISIKNHVTAIVIALFRNRHESVKSSSNFEKNDMRLQATVDYIINNYNSKITLEQCAEMAYMSISHFSRQFRLVTGLNFKEYLNRIRIEKACEILKKETVRNKTLLAQEVGFSSGSYFTYVFRSYTGLSPTQYQKKYKNKNGSH